jgi:thiamine-phosphate pyrophosphorylase
LRLPPLYAILDVAVARRHNWQPASLARAFLDGGARLLQVRAKSEASGSWLALCDEVVRLAGSYGARVIVNDRADLARLAAAAGVHVGQDDLPAARARALVGDDMIVGLSTHSVSQIEAGAAAPVDYLAVGPVFGTGTKDTGYAPVGVALVREAHARGGGKPIVGIGGITLDNAQDVLDAGAQSVAVISDLLATRDPAARVREYVARLGE